MKKVVATETAKALIEKLQKLHGSLALIHSEGCCDGTSPICLKRDDFYLGSQDKKIGEILDVPYYMHNSNHSYWEHLQIVVDAIEGFGNSFSLESSEDKSFIIRANKLEINSV